MLACELTWSLALGVFLCGEFSWLGEKKKGIASHTQGFFFYFKKI
jgi:hypothetical protein